MAEWTLYVLGGLGRAYCADETRDRILAELARQRARFAEDAAACVLRERARRGPTSGEALTAACKAAGIVARDDRAFGPVYVRLVRAGLIEKVGTARRERGHGTAGGNLWALVAVRS